MTCVKDKVPSVELEFLPKPVVGKALRMKKTLGKLPAAVSLVLLGAHFLRMQEPFFVALSLCLIPLLFLQNRRVILAIKLCLFLGSALWVTTLWMIVMERKAQGLAFAGVVMILGPVAVFTLLSAILIKPHKP